MQSGVIENYGNNKIKISGIPESVSELRDKVEHVVGLLGATQKPTSF